MVIPFFLDKFNYYNFPKRNKYEGLITANKLEMLKVSTGKKTILAEGESQISQQAYSADYKMNNYAKDGVMYNIPTNFAKEIEINKTIKKEKAPMNRAYLYYSEFKNGSNQIWRKLPDGTQAEQLTWEINNSRDPQLSPDGKSVAYMVYSHDSNPKTAQNFQKITLKVLPVAGGAPKTIAYIYGGKGSLAPNCWSGNSKSIVFTSK